MPLQAFALRIANLPFVLPIRVYRLLYHILKGFSFFFFKWPKPKRITDSIGFWWFELSFVLLECLCVPEIYETLNDLLKRNIRGLSHSETEIAKSVFGKSIDCRRVRIDEKATVGCRKHHIIYVSFYTINSWGKFTHDLLIHELVHVWQYEKMGAVYIPRALQAQKSGMGYNYGGVENLKKFKCLDDFNLEQQADIIADYFRIKQGLLPTWGNGKQADLHHYLRYVDEISEAGGHHLVR